MRYLRILKPSIVYSSHDFTSHQIKTLETDTIIPYNREKRRNNTDWMEIYLEEGKAAYIKKEDDNFQKCKNVTLDEKSAQGYSITYKTDFTPPIDSIFFPTGTLAKSENIDIIHFKNIEDSDEYKATYMKVEYDKTLVDVETFNLTKNEQFYIINDTYNNGSIFMEIDNFKGKKGIILMKTAYTAKEDSWTKPVGILIGFLVIGGLIAAGLSQGWLIISRLMIIPAFIVVVITIFILNIVLSVLKKGFEMIRKRY